MISHICRIFKKKKKIKQQNGSYQGLGMGVNGEMIDGQRINFFHNFQL